MADNLQGRCYEAEVHIPGKVQGHITMKSVKQKVFSKRILFVLLDLEVMYTAENFLPLSHIHSVITCKDNANNFEPQDHFYSVAKYSHLP